MTTSILTNKKLKYVLTACFWLLLWQAFSSLLARQLILPGPLTVGKRLLELALTGEFWQTIAVSLFRIMAGYFLGIVAGVVLAFATCSSRWLDALLSPVIRIIRATPVASFIILAMLWLPKSGVAVLMAALMVIPVIWENMYQQYHSVDEKLVEVGRVYRFSNLKSWQVIYFPSMLAGFRAACLTGMGLGWKSGIAAEVLSQPRQAIGTNVYNAKVYLETADLFAWTITVIILSFLLEKLVRRILVERGKTA